MNSNYILDDLEKVNESLKKIKDQGEKQLKAMQEVAKAFKVIEGVVKKWETKLES